MSEHAVIVPTALGPTAGVVSEPDGDRRAAIILLAGDGGPCRAGINAAWARLARELANLGLVVLRFDVAHYGDGSQIPRDRDVRPGEKEDVDLTLLREVSAWFRDRLDGLELFVAGSCRGGRLALELPPHDRDVAGVFTVAPYLRNAAVPPAEREAEAAPDDLQLLHDSIVEGLRRLLAAGRPVWVLMGERDGRDADRLKQLLGAEGERLEIETVADMRLHPVVSAEAQREVGERLTRRIARALERATAA